MCYGTTTTFVKNDKVLSSLLVEWVLDGLYYLKTKSMIYKLEQAF